MSFEGLPEAIEERLDGLPYLLIVVGDGIPDIDTGQVGFPYAYLGGNGICTHNADELIVDIATKIVVRRIFGGDGKVNTDADTIERVLRAPKEPPYGGGA